MGMYCSIDDLKELVSRDDTELMRLTNSTDVLDVSLLESIIASSSGIVDIYVTVIESNIDKFITLATAKIAIYYLFQRTNQECPKTVKEGFLEMIQLLKDMRDKKVANNYGNVSSFNKNTTIQSRTVSQPSRVLDIFGMKL